jgi:hypothetical protein
MKFNRIFFLLLILISTNCFSQLTGEADITDVTKVTFFNPGVSYEKRIGKFQSLYAQAFLNTSFALGFSDALGSTFSLNLNFGIGYLLQQALLSMMQDSITTTM